MLGIILALWPRQVARMRLSWCLSFRLKIVLPPKSKLLDPWERLAKSKEERLRITSKSLENLKGQQLLSLAEGQLEAIA